MKVDDQELDPNNKEFNHAVEFIKHTNKLVYLTGKAGTGKTTFLKYIIKTIKKNTVVVAPTGVAAINAGGVSRRLFIILTNAETPHT
jgi:ABC-type cobalamin/Fe3+-siderophores transport system ATPase subunit